MLISGNKVRGKPFHILSLDGGGTWSFIQARVLGELYGHDTPGHQILRTVDLAAGNSGGSLVLAGLLCNYTPAQIAEFFLNEKFLCKIFCPLRSCEKSVFHALAAMIGVAPRYSTERKFQALGEVLKADGDRFLSDFPAYVGNPGLQILIPIYDYYRNRAVFCRSNLLSQSHSPEFFRKTVHGIPSPGHITLKEAVHGSSQAPVLYFDRPAVIYFRKDHSLDPRLAWDGAVAGFNNPVLTAVIEALANGVDPRSIVITSIGTAIEWPLMMAPGESVDAEKAPYFVEATYPGIISDLKKMALSVLSDPPDSANYMAYVIIEPDLRKPVERFFRFNPVIQGVRNGKTVRPPRGWKEKDFYRLLRLGLDATRKKDLALINSLVHSWMDPEGEVPNQAIRYSPDGSVWLGHSTFAEVRLAWSNMFSDLRLS